MYKYILIPTDGSQLSHNAIAHGAALARSINARVTILTVSTPFHTFAFEPEMVTDTQEQYAKHMANWPAKYLTSAKEAAAAAGVNCDTVHVEHDHPYQAIIDTAAPSRAILSSWPRTAAVEYLRSCWAAKRSRY
jgi:nucleotide-binding universal stress UspA family protein